MFLNVFGLINLQHESSRQLQEVHLKLASQLGEAESKIKSLQIGKVKRLLFTLTH